MTTRLFQLHTTTEAVQIGWAGGDDVDDALGAICRELQSNDAAVFWQYAATRGSGGIEIAPFRRIAVFRAHVTRIEPVQAEQPVVDLPT